MNIRFLFKKFYILLQAALYSKNNYKLFLKKNFDEIDQDTRRVQLLLDIYTQQIQPIEINAPFADTILIMAPHQDDESIGCGGAILAQTKQGKKVELVFVSDGGEEYADLGHDTREQMAEVREQEVMAACKVANIQSTPVFLRLVEFTQNIENTINRLVTILNEKKPGAIFTPFFIDGHEEHVMTTYFLAQALKQVAFKPKIYCYEVWSQVIPNVILDITEQAEEKKRMIACHDSQCSVTNYVDSVLGLNSYAARILGRHCTHAERYFEMSSEAFIETADKLNTID